MSKFSDGRRVNVVNTLSSLKVYSLTYFPRYLHPNNALILNGNCDDEEEAFVPYLGLQATYPLQLHLPTNLNATVEANIVLKLVQQKDQYINDAAKLSGNFKRSRNSGSKKTKANIYSMHLNNLMELTVKDPDPFFFGSYNWYYTGGLLETASIFDVEFLFYVNGEKLNTFNSATLNSNKDRLQLEHLDSTNKVICDTIFEVSKSNDSRYVAARQKYNYTVFYLQDELAQQDFQCERNIPFMSGTFVDNYFYSIDANRVVQRYDLSKNKECGRMYLKLAKNNSFWCQLKTYNNHLIFADDHKVKVYDHRLFAKKASKCMQIYWKQIVPSMLVHALQESIRVCFYSAKNHRVKYSISKFHGKQPEIDDKLFRDIDLGRKDVRHEPKVTTATNFDSIKRILKFNLPNDTEIPDTDNPQPKNWQLSMEQLSWYKDMLSSDLLNVWNEQHITTEDKTDKTELVSGWINKTS